MKRYLYPLILVASLVTGVVSGTVHARLGGGSGSIGGLDYTCTKSPGDRKGVCQCTWFSDCDDLARSGECSGDFYCTGSVCRCIWNPAGSKVLNF